MTMCRINLVRGLGPVADRRGLPVGLPDEVAFGAPASDISPGFVPNLTGEERV